MIYSTESHNCTKPRMLFDLDWVNWLSTRSWSKSLLFSPFVVDEVIVNAIGIIGTVVVGGGGNMSQLQLPLLIVPWEGKVRANLKRHLHKLETKQLRTFNKFAPKEIRMTFFFVFIFNKKSELRATVYLISPGTMFYACTSVDVQKLALIS